MLGVLAIMGVITVAAIGLITSAMRSMHRSNVQDHVAQIVNEVRAIYGEYDDYSMLDNATVFASMRGMSSRNPYGGEYAISVHPLDARQFVLAITGLSRSDCLFFRTRAWTDSVGFQTSDGRVSGAEADPFDCGATDGRNIIRIIFN